MREFVERDFVQPLALRLGADELGGALAIACIAGVALLRDVLGVTALREASLDEIQPMIAKLMRACLAPVEEPTGA